MTTLTKPIARECRIEPRGGKASTLQVIVTLYPGGVIGLRDKGRRKEYTLPLSTVYYLAAEAEAQRMMAERRTKRKERKAQR
jgi:hypothetical protein